MFIKEIKIEDMVVLLGYIYIHRIIYWCILFNIYICMQTKKPSSLWFNPMPSNWKVWPLYRWSPILHLLWTRPESYTSYKSWRSNPIHSHSQNRSPASPQRVGWIADTSIPCCSYRLLPEHRWWSTSHCICGKLACIGGRIWPSYSCWAGSSRGLPGTLF